MLLISQSTGTLHGASALPGGDCRHPVVREGSSSRELMFQDVCSWDACSRLLDRLSPSPLPQQPRQSKLPLFFPHDFLKGNFLLILLCPFRVGLGVVRERAKERINEEELIWNLIKIHCDFTNKFHGGYFGSNNQWNYAQLCFCLL